MGEKLRSTGIDSIGYVPWGTCFSQLYETKQELIDIIVPYFKEGLENNELCFWGLPNSITKAEAEDALSKGIHNFDIYLGSGQIVIVSYDEVYAKISNIVLDNGYEGIRAVVDESFDEITKGESLLEYGEKFNLKVIVLSTYSLKNCLPTDIIDVLQKYQFVLIKKKEDWILVESSRFKSTKATLERVNRLYSILTKINHAIIRIQEEKILYEEACRVAVEDGLFKIAWVGVIDNTTNSIKPAAQWGIRAEEVSKLKKDFITHGPKQGGIIENVMLRGDYSFTHNIKEEVEGMPWRDDIISYNINSCAVFPLKVEEKIIGIMVFYSEERWFSDEEEISLLQNLCNDISFAIRTIELEKIRKVSEENAKLLSEAREYDKLKTEFFANISHELRTPINIILSAIQLLNIYFVEGNIYKENDKISKYIYSMQQNCYRLLRLISNIIDITKIDSGYFELQLNNHNIVSIVEDITLSVSEYIEHKGITLLFDTDSEEKNIACDSDKIDRVMLNLLSNAVKFTRPGGSILVNVYDKTDKVLIKIKDDGIGIEEDKKDLIFNRFHQVDKSLTRSHEGSGIGLSIVKSLVELHGGSITVDSKYGKGTEFTIELPAKQVCYCDAIMQEAVKGENIEKINIEFSDIS